MVSVELAELAGLFAADGNMQEEHLSFWGHHSEDKQYYDEVISVYVVKVFGFRPNCHEKASNGVYGFYICRQGILEPFKSLGFSPGRKTYTVRAPNKIMTHADSAVKAAFIRGVFDGDGCLHFLRRKGKYCQFKRNFHTYPRIIISSRSFGLIDDVKRLLDEFEIRGTVTIHKPSYPWENAAKVLTVRGAEMLEKWMDKICMSNMAHRSKYLLWKKEGHCPTKTTLKHRLRLLYPS